MRYVRQSRDLVKFIMEGQPSPSDWLKKYKYNSFNLYIPWVQSYLDVSIKILVCKTIKMVFGK